MWLLSFLGGNWLLALCVLLVVVALIAIGILAKNWKVLVAAALLVAAGFAYQQIDKNGYQRRAAEDLAAQLEAKDEAIARAQARIDLLNAANSKDAAKAIADTAKLRTLEDQVNATPANATIALDRSAAGRVRDIQWDAPAATPAKGGTADGPRRHSKLLPWRH